MSQKQKGLIDQNEVEEGQVADDSSQESSARRLPHPSSPDQPQRDPSLSSNEIVFETVTDAELVSEKKRKKIHKQHKEKRTGAIQKKKQRNHQRERKIEKSNMATKLNQEREHQLPPHMFSSFSNPIHSSSPSMFTPPQPQYYPQYFYPLPPHHRPNVPLGGFYPFVPQQPYISPPLMGNHYAYKSAPMGMPQQHQMSLGPFQGGGGGQQSIAAMQPNMTPLNIPVIEGTKMQTVRGPISNSEFSRDNRSTAYLDRQGKELNQKNQQSKANWTGSGSTYPSRQEERTQNQIEVMRSLERQIGSDNIRKKSVHEEVKGVVRRYLKNFNYQEQLNILEVTRCLVKCGKQSLSSSGDCLSIRNTVYQRSLHTIQCLGTESQEKKESLNKILEVLHLQSVSLDLKERKLYSWAMKDPHFIQINATMDKQLKNPYQTLCI